MRLNFGIYRAFGTYSRHLKRISFAHFRVTLGIDTLRTFHASNELTYLSKNQYIRFGISHLEMGHTYISSRDLRSVLNVSLLDTRLKL